MTAHPERTPKLFKLPIRFWAGVFHGAIADAVARHRYINLPQRVRDEVRDTWWEAFHSSKTCLDLWNKQSIPLPELWQRLWRTLSAEARDGLVDPPTLGHVYMGLTAAHMLCTTAVERDTLEVAAPMVAGRLTFFHLETPTPAAWQDVPIVRQFNNWRVSLIRNLLPLIVEHEDRVAGVRVEYLECRSEHYKVLAEVDKLGLLDACRPMICDGVQRLAEQVERGETPTRSLRRLLLRPNWDGFKERRVTLIASVFGTGLDLDKYHSPSPVDHLEAEEVKQQELRDRVARLGQLSTRQREVWDATSKLDKQKELKKAWGREHARRLEDEGLLKVSHQALNQIGRRIQAKLLP